ncbi:cysteine desulfurase family protein [Halobacteroides halobius DSM 5150]|uniref:cysteine desulfurase n=1 Tax=Halobacteroides halobius (strain ATCC 35273 / DSM 5150 / MD-1) TaxID=748449 RepID=L0KEK1_HALHC|nr:aminotransferase class V-fold PLP-dependent enzyme [Halobacteroides halobius]AGB42493.1 cysteine desulfurase family protein [Halobacteroides halobius DSM 5150]
MIYLDNAATSWPKPEVVYQTMDQFMRHKAANPGRAGHKMAAQAGELVWQTRNLLAKFFNAHRSQEIILTKNATEALNLALQGYLEAGDHVVTTSLAHNSILRPLKEFEPEIEVTIVEADNSGQIKLEQIEASLQQNTKLVAVTHASNVTGFLLPIKEIGELLEEKDIKFLVDAAQTAGVYPLDVQEMKIDMLAFTGHKSLFGPPGTGGLYLNNSIELKPLLSGGTGSNSEDIYQPRICPDRYESGTANTVGLAGLKAGIEFILEEGLDSIRQHEEELLDYLISKLKEIPEITLYGPTNINKQAPLLSVNFGAEDSGELGYILDKAFDIAVRTGLHCAPLAHRSLGTFQRGTVRFSLGYFNTLDELEEVIRVSKEIAAKL